MALFGEKYGDVVRMVEVGDGRSPASCAAARTCARPRRSALFKVTGEGSSAANVRRIEAITGPEAVALRAPLTTRCCSRRRPCCARARARPGGDRRAARAQPSRRRSRRARAATPGRTRASWPAARRDVAARRSWPRSSMSPSRRRCWTLADRVKGRLGDCRDRARRPRSRAGCTSSPPWRPRWCSAASRRARSSRSPRQIAGGGGGGRDTMAQAGGRDPEQAARGDRRRARRDRAVGDGRAASRNAMRVLALDYGSARCGCALSDPDRHAGHAARARPARRARARACARIERSCASAGSSGSSSGCRWRSPGATRRRRRRRARSPNGWRERLAVPVELYDERFTTRLAQRDAGRAASRGLPRGGAPARGLARGAGLGPRGIASAAGHGSDPGRRGRRRPPFGGGARARPPRARGAPAGRRTAAA